MAQRLRLAISESVRSPSLGQLVKALEECADLRAVPDDDAARELLATHQVDAILVHGLGARGAGPEESPTLQLGPTLDSRELLRLSPVGMAVLDHDLRLRWNNRAFQRHCPPGRSLFGQTLSDALGLTEIEDKHFQALRECLATQPAAHARMRLPSGRWLDVDVHRLHDYSSHSGPAEVSDYICTVRDVTTEVKEYEKLLAIHRAGLEFNHLSPEELAKMSATERTDLLKANILQYSKSVLKFTNLELRLLQPDGKLRVLISEGIDSPESLEVLEASAVGNGVTGYVAATGKRYLCADTQADPRYIPGALNARSSLTVPVLYREQLVGTFNVESTEPNKFTVQDADFLEIFAREIAGALHTLDLLTMEKSMGGRTSVDEILRETSLPVDEILTDAIRLLGFLHDGSDPEAAREAARKIMLNARGVKSTFRRAVEQYQAAASTTVARQQTKAAPRILAGKRILIADATPEVRQAAHSYLAQVGCEVDTARDGREALSLLRTVPYDTAIADIRLPDMNGYEFLCAVQDTMPEVPVVLMTGFGYDANHCMVKARQRGQRIFLYKPFSLDRLCEAIEDALRPAASDPSGAIPRVIASTEKIVL